MYGVVIYASCGVVSFYVTLIMRMSIIYNNTNDWGNNYFSSNIEIIKLVKTTLGVGKVVSNNGFMYYTPPLPQQGRHIYIS